MLLMTAFVQAQEKGLTQGMKITRTTKIKKGHYKIMAPDSPKEGVILIEGNNIIVDFNNAELAGTRDAGSPDRFTGIGILVQNSKHVTIRNLKARGFKIALLALHTEQLTLENCDLSYNYRPRLNSTQEKEDLSDWMSYHQNDKDEWMRYGAAIYLRDCNGAIIRDCEVTGGQNALMMTECNDGLIYNNDFSFNSGIGIGLYRSSRNSILYNRIIFNVRGYSHGVYNRGQDSAGLLVYEQSSGNLFYKNNVTHGGDGLFLWAGQTTMDSGKGGCNDNRILNNDFSYAPTNGVEATFSRNLIAGNRMFECDHGIWAGYSYGSIISNNQFRNNRIGIAIEHGQQNKISYNIFSRDQQAIRLWANEETADWGYPKYRDTHSGEYRILSNSFNSNPLVFNLAQTTGLRIFNNTISGAEQVFRLDSTVNGLDTLPHDDLVDETLPDSTGEIPVISRPSDPFRGNGYLAGRKSILVTEWGPYDYRSPIIWNTNPTGSGDTMQFDIRGPKGRWVVKNFSGIAGLSAMKGEVPGSLTGRKIEASHMDIRIELEYVGAAITTPFGERLAAGKPYSFVFRKFFQPIAWDVSWFSLDTGYYNPIRTGQLFSPNVRMAPVKTEKTDRLDYAWWGGLKAGRTYPQFITMASGQADFDPGVYELSVTWDDAVRVWVDNKLVVDEWVPSRYKFDESPNRKIRLDLAGNHQFRVEHLELGGFATLNLQIKKLQ